MQHPRFVVDENNKTEPAPIRGFSVSKRVQEKIMELIRQEAWNPEEAILIPDCDGMVLVKFGSRAFHERMDKKAIFKIPFTLNGTIDGKPVELKFIVCTS